MKALVFHGTRSVRVEEMPDPKPAKGELLLRSLAVGVCFSDKNAYETGWSLYKPGIVLGHEGCGEIAAIGEGVEDWHVGERVAVYPLIYCGHCTACLMGRHINCQQRAAKHLGSGLGVDALRDEDRGMYHGLLADYCVLPAQNCYYLPPNVDNLAGANVEVMAVALNAVRCSGVLPGDNVVFMGLDDFNAAAMKFLPTTHSVVVDPLAVRQELATRLGADWLLDPAKVNAVREVRKLMPFGADMVFVSTEDYFEPSLEYPNQAHRVVCIHGTILIMRFQRRGNIGDGVPYSFTKGVTIKLPGLFSEDISRGGKPRSDYQMVIDSLASGKVDGTFNVSKVIPFKDITSKSDVDEIFAMLPKKETKVVITMK